MREDNYEFAGCTTRKREISDFPRASPGSPRRRRRRGRRRSSNNSLRLFSPLADEIPRLRRASGFAALSQILETILLPLNLVKHVRAPRRGSCFQISRNIFEKDRKKSASTSRNGESVYRPCALASLTNSRLLPAIR